MGRLITTLLIAALATEGAKAEGLRGRSADLGFTFETSRSPWCGKVVEIALSASEAGTYRRDRRALEQALGRLRAAVLAPRECPRTQLIQVDAKVGEETILRATMAAFSRWVIVWEPKADGRPSCFDATAEDACVPYAGAYRLWREIALSDGAPSVQLSTFLDTQRATQAEWTAPGLSGQLRVLPVDPQDRETNAGLIAQALTENAAEACRTGWGIEKNEAITERIARRAFGCKQGKATTYEDLIVAQHDGYFFVFSSRATSASADGLTRFNTQLGAALAGIVMRQP